MKDCIYIPPSRQVGEKHLREALGVRLEELTRPQFMKAYCSLAYLYPGFHPDGIEDWDGPDDVLAIAKEAWRRAEAGELNDNELYPYQATKAGLRGGRTRIDAQAPVRADRKNR